MEKRIENQRGIKLENETVGNIKSRIERITKAVLESQKEELDIAKTDIENYLRGVLAEIGNSSAENTLKAIGEIVEMHIASVKNVSHKEWPENIRQMNLEGHKKILFGGICSMITGDFDLESQIERFRPKMK